MLQFRLWLKTMAIKTLKTPKCTKRCKLNSTGDNSKRDKPNRCSTKCRQPGTMVYQWLHSVSSHTISSTHHDHMHTRHHNRRSIRLTGATDILKSHRPLQPSPTSSNSSNGNRLRCKHRWQPNNNSRWRCNSSNRLRLSSNRWLINSNSSGLFVTSTRMSSTSKTTIRRQHDATIRQHDHVNKNRRRRPSSERTPRRKAPPSESKQKAAMQQRSMGVEEQGSGRAEEQRSTGATEQEAGEQGTK